MIGPPVGSACDRSKPRNGGLLTMKACGRCRSVGTIHRCSKGWFVCELCGAEYHPMSCWTGEDLACVCGLDESLQLKGS